MKNLLKINLKINLNYSSTFNKWAFFLHINKKEAQSHSKSPQQLQHLKELNQFPQHVS